MRKQAQTSQPATFESIWNLLIYVYLLTALMFTQYLLAVERFEMTEEHWNLGG
jgi:hypothetical protein